VGIGENYYFEFRYRMSATIDMSYYIPVMIQGPEPIPIYYQTRSYEEIVPKQTTESKSEKVFIGHVTPTRSSPASSLVIGDKARFQRAIRLKNVLRTLHERFAEFPSNRQRQLQEKLRSKLAAHFAEKPVPEYLDPQTCARFCLYFWKELNTDELSHSNVIKAASLPPTLLDSETPPVQDPLASIEKTSSEEA